MNSNELTEQFNTLRKQFRDVLQVLKLVLERSQRIQIELSTCSTVLEVIKKKDPSRRQEIDGYLERARNNISTDRELGGAILQLQIILEKFWQPSGATLPESEFSAILQAIRQRFQHLN